MSVQRKKMAFIKSIRDQQLNNYFSTRRQELEQSISQDQNVIVKLQYLFDQLPASIIAIVQQLNQNFQLVSQFLITNLKQFCSKMVGTQNVEWCYFVSAINRLLVSTADKTVIQTIIKESFLPVLESADRQVKQASNFIMKNQIMKYVLQYCFRLGGYVQSLHILQQNVLVNTMKMLWDYGCPQEGELSQWSEEGELSLVVTSINILKANFDQDNQQNISNEQRNDIEITKIKLVKLIFYGQSNQKRLKRIIHRMMDLSTQQQLELLSFYMRLVVIFTAISQDTIYFVPLLNNNILYIISSLFNTYKNFKHKKHSISVIILNVRLLNNILVNDINLTLQILKDILLSKVIQLYHLQPTSTLIQAEIAELFINFAHFVNDQVEIIRNMIENGITEIMIQALQIFRQTNDDMCLRQCVSTLFILLNSNKIVVKRIIRQNQKKLRQIIEEQVSISEVLQNILNDCVVEPIYDL